MTLSINTVVVVLATDTGSMVVLSFGVLLRDLAEPLAVTGSVAVVVHSL